MVPVNVIKGFLFSLLAMLLFFLLFRHLWLRPGKIRNRAINFLVLGFTTIFLFLGVEYYFSTRYAVSDTFIFTLSSRLWFEKYWRPINSMGYRDVEHSPESFNGKKVLFVVGDSIVAGHGIEDIKDRFANLLADELGNKWRVVVIAKNGWGTVKEGRAIRNYPRRPDVIILSYYINDIDETVRRLTGSSLPIEPRIELNDTVEKIIAKSYFINALFWRYYRRKIGSPYWGFLYESYKNQRIWREHLTELKYIIDYSKSKRSKLLVVVWPKLNQIEKSEFFTSRIVDYLKSENVPVLDLAPLFRGRAAARLIVNKLDGHPNESVHHEVGQLLFGKLKQLELVE